LRDKACRISAVCPSGDKACPIFVCPVCLSDCTVFPIFPRQVCANQGEMVAYRFFPGCARDHNCAVHLLSVVCLCEDKAYPISAACQSSVCLTDCTVSPIFPRQVCANRGAMVAYRFCPGYASDPGENKVFPNHDAVVAYRSFPGYASDHNCAVRLFSVVCLCEDKVYRISAICPISVCPNEVVSLIFPRQVCVSRAGMVAYRSFRSFAPDRNCAVRLFSVVCLYDYKVYQISAVSRISAAYPISACPSEVVSLIFPQVRANLCAVIGLRNRSLVCVKLDVVGDSRN
ncbi:MAG TPA: hypothetical protein PLW55_04075, partial [Leptospiraceae bacterium]|nr:hypothetical protein [Leptospiraceae bacterium]